MVQDLIEVVPVALRQGPGQIADGEPERLSSGSLQRRDDHSEAIDHLGINCADYVTNGRSGALLAGRHYLKTTVSLPLDLSAKAIFKTGGVNETKLL